LDSNINSIDLFNLGNDTVLRAQRSGAGFTDTGESLDAWNARGGGLQTNAVYLRDGREIVAYHQIYRFEDTKPVAVIAIHQRLQYQLQDILGISRFPKTNLILIFNDQNDLFEADLGNNGDVAMEKRLQSWAKLRIPTAEKNRLIRQFLVLPHGGRRQAATFCRPLQNKAIVHSLRQTLLAGVSVSLAGVAAAVLASAAYAKFISKLAHRTRVAHGAGYRAGYFTAVFRAADDATMRSGCSHNSFADMAGTHDKT
jgi:hypothetical protein